MAINLWAVLTCGILAMAIGAIWYGPIFGKKWMEIIGVDANDKEAMKKMQKEALPLYLIQFLLVLFQVYILAHYIFAESNITSLEHAMLFYSAFIMPTIAGAVMWNNDSKESKITRFIIQAGYQLILFIMFGFVFYLFT